MLNRLIQFSLKNRMLVLAIAAFTMVYGIIAALSLPVDVLPDLNRPRVTLFLEANGMAPEEVETRIVFPVESALNGAPGVEVVRSNSTSGLGMVFVEFGWGTDVYRARQMVAERMQTVTLPEGVVPVMGPISSVMGQFMLLGITSDTVSQQELRTLADFTIRRRLMGIKGMAQVIPIGGERLQYRVTLKTQALLTYGITSAEIEKTLMEANQNSTGGFVEKRGNEFLIRAEGRLKNTLDISSVMVENKQGQKISLGTLAEVSYGSAYKRGDAGINGGQGVILSLEKQPGVSTVALTKEVEQAIGELSLSLPHSIHINTRLFQQKGFIEHAIGNVKEALRDGFILVVIVLFLFLLNFRTTIITLTAIPLSILITSIVFTLFDISINTLTLGGLAIAIGELVDDAIVDVENVFRRLKENAKLANKKPILTVVFEASSEVRNSIVYATIIVVLVFIPLFYLQGMEGKIFAPLGLAYITSILASLFVSLTVTPVLCSYLLKKLDHKSHADSSLVRFLKRQDTRLLHWSLKRTKGILIGVGIMLVSAAALVPFFGNEFLPPFNEGSFTINLSLPPGTSLTESNRIGKAAELILKEIPEVEFVSRRTGRAELDEHVEPVSNSEIEVTLKENIQRKQSEILKEVREKISELGGARINIGQPISHRLDHLLSGVRAQVVVKIFGEDLRILGTQADAVVNEMKQVEGFVDVQKERQVLIPQIRVIPQIQAMQSFGINPGDVAAEVERMMNGKVTGQVIDGIKQFDILIRQDEEERKDPNKIKEIPIATADGTLVPLGRIAEVIEDAGINTIGHENSRRRMVVSANIEGRDLGSAVQEMKQKLANNIKLPAGYYFEFAGQHESQQSATKLIVWLAIFAVGGIFIALYHHFKSWLMVLQVMVNIPLGLIGSVAAVWITGGTFSVASLVGFITMTGIASRNGIMMISHYIHLIEHEGERFSRSMIIRGSLERLVPVLMTALVAALALIPLTLNPEAAGKEILYPVATVILGGLLSSTLLDILVTPVLFAVIGKRALKDYFKAKNEAA